MTILQSSSLLVMGELVRGALRQFGGGLGEAVSTQAVSLLHRRFADHSQRLTVAITRAGDRAWRALEIALEGDSLWGRLRQKVTSTTEDRAFASEVQQYLQHVTLDGGAIDRASCLAQLRTARKAGALKQGALTAADLASQADQFARFHDPSAVLRQEMQAGRSIADALRPGYPHLAALLTVQAREGGSLFAVALRYFFRRAVEEDEQLARGLAFAQFERLQAGQEEGLAALHRALDAVGDRIEGLLGEVAVHVRETHQNVLGLVEEQQQQGQQLRAMYEAVLQLQQRFDVARAEVRPRDSLSIRGEAERGLVKQLVERYRSLPADQRRRLPALLNGIGKLEIAAGDFDGASQDFATVAGLVPEGAARGEAHFNAYRAALERRQWGEALGHLMKAVAADAGRYAPFPVDKYAPRRILGAGGFGVAFLCDHTFLKAPVVVKTISDGELERGIDAVFGEAQALSQVTHPAIIRLQDCGFAAAGERARPYLAMEFFEGPTLEELVEKRGPLSDRDALALVWQVAAGLDAAHAKGVLHRDVKPANVLVRQAEGEWEVKLIDFGLAVRQASAAGLAMAAGTLAGASIAGTLDYAAPEQMGKLPGAPVTPRSDIYSLARTCCYALFGTPSPRGRHWDSITPSFRDFLEPCLADRPDERPASMSEVFELLSRVRGKKAAPPARPAPTPPPPVPPPLRPVLDAIPVVELVSPPSPPQVAEAESLLAALRRNFDPVQMERLGALLRWLGQNAPGERFASLLSQTQALLAGLVRNAAPPFRPVPGKPLQAAPEPRPAAALTWHVLLSLRGRAPDRGVRQ